MAKWVPGARDQQRRRRESQIKETLHLSAEDRQPVVPRPAELLPPPPPDEIAPSWYLARYQARSHNLSE